ncbi:MAG: SRPBCC family protein, partial [Halobacteriales archaeon]|nr:SRPBCC family protein [Halobacteriales archaeon]
SRAMGEHVVLHWSRELRVPLGPAYAWLTDYQDDDPQRAGAIIKARPVVERTRDKVVLQGHLEVLGRTMSGTADVHLFPPDRWEARFRHKDGGLNGSVYLYKLTPTANGCRLDVDYRFRARRLKSKLRLTLAKPAIRRELDKMWDGFIASMERDLKVAA